jgi:phosphoribosylamine--glycine ligase
LSGRENVAVYQAGLGRTADGLEARGGRVLTVTGLGATLPEARERAYEAMAALNLPGGFYRRDIGWRALKR